MNVRGDYADLTADGNLAVDPVVTEAADRKLTWRPRGPSLALVEAAREVLDTAQASGFRLTLRAVYYRLVAANLIPNDRHSYKRCAELLGRARWAGLLARDSIEDLERVLTEWQTFDNPAEALRDLAATFATDRWAVAPYRVEVWAEKRAVAGILQPVAGRYLVPFMAGRGFSSLTALHDLANRSRASPVLVLYCGDHDPSGLEMDCDLQGRIAALGGRAVLRRVALTPEQIEAYSLPPQPTKATDSRTHGYTHDGSWELDALPPAVLAALVADAIREHLPPDFADRREADRAVQSRLAALAADVA